MCAFSTDTKILYMHSPYAPIFLMRIHPIRQNLLCKYEDKLCEKVENLTLLFY
jgi:hypothetical protein